MKPHIVIVDDNPRFIKGLIVQLRALASNLLLTNILTTDDFDKYLPLLLKDPPHLFLMDILLPWRELSIAPDFRFIPYAAGYQLANIVHGQESLQDVPIVFYSAAEHDRDHAFRYIEPAARSNLYWSSKNEADEKVARLLISLASAQTAVEPVVSSNAQSLLDAFELKPGAFGLKVDIKKLLRLGKRDDG